MNRFFFRILSFILAVTGILALSACKNKQVITSDNLVVAENPTRTSDIPVGSSATALEIVEKKVPSGDPFVLNSMKLSGQTLQLNVSYSGGCKEHSFALYSTMRINNSERKGLTLWLQHEANEDLCEAWKTQQLSFDLSALNALNEKEFMIWINSFEFSVKYPSS